MEDYYDDYDDDYCYECRGYGYDYYVDDDGDLVSNSEDCPYNSAHREE